jgi:O-glycosyl hydrolase
LTVDSEKTTVYASIDSVNANKLWIVAINKTDQWLETEIQITNPAPLQIAAVYQFTSSSSQPQFINNIDTQGNNTFFLSMPPMGVSTLELE